MNLKFIPLIFICIATFVLNGCVPQSSSGGKRKTSKSGSTTTTEDSPNDPTFNTTAGSIFWYSGSEIPGTITLNSNLQTVVYLRGTLVHEFLNTDSNASDKYCMVASFSDSALVKQIRLQVVPISFTNFNTNSLERAFRVDVPNPTDSKTTCNGDAYQLTSGGLLSAIIDSDVSTTDVEFDLPGLCANCTGIKTADDVSLYVAPALSTDSLDISNRILPSTLDLSTIGLRVDVQSQSTQQTSTCTTSSCRAKGFDCCSGGQCVNDGEIKSNAQTSFPTQFAQAMADIVNNPNAFFNYPNIFFICSSPPAVGATPTAVPDATEEQKDRAAQLRLDYLCLESAELTTPVYDDGECSDTTKDTKALCEAASATWTFFCQVGTCSDTSKYSKATCEAASATWTTVFENGDQENGETTGNAYVTIRNDVWKRCGCEAEPFPTDPDAPQCPDYGLEATIDSLLNITDVTCKIPQPLNEPTPFQNLSISISGRSAPHRFYRSDTGASVDDISTLTNVSPEVLPEGTPFSYLDEIGKTDPQNGEFNINSLTGQFKVALNSALPAQTINVEFDQTYVISAISGFYTPCPKCANDSWFAAFTSNPPSQQGTGLQAVGFSTNRSEYQNNLTNGNYEDTAFGRACWLPPTMIPFTHTKIVGTQSQRMARLAAQSAMYINGYQRDWFGFNKGALIGSFDGVAWFAVGRGRRITASSTKLFLALNGAYSDLAEPTDTIVSITSDLGGTDIVANYDYDPSVSLTDPRQNQGGTCQFWHQCNVDTDCVTKLGWEYSCIDTSEYRSRWPRFDINGDEKENDAIDEATFTSILQGLIPPGTKKRCVYRGSGAACKKNYTNSLTAAKQKMFTCAPNFYCADINASEFNNEVVRNPNQLDTFLFGQEADVLGRPVSYIGASKGFDAQIVTNIKDNFSIHTSDTGDIGLCRPGKKLSTTSLTDQHIDKDSSRRTDHINQISSCDSGAVGTDRVVTCPIFETRTGQSTAVGDIINDSFELAMRHEQNQCGAEAKKDSGASVFESTFKQIELATLASIGNIVQPSIVRDACFRRPGSVCHTDLDCSPNRLHAQEAVFFGPTAFGGTTAELNYWSESLICGQSADKPILQDPDFESYDLTKNRCCREIGADLTMYTQDNDGIVPDNPSGDAGVLDTTFFPYDFEVGTTSTTGYYSRYTVASAALTGVAQTTPVAEKPQVIQDTVPKSYQWKSFADTGSKTCCGGGWIRKFADGTNNWSNSSRLNINPVQLTCLNYRNELVIEAPSEVTLGNYQKDLDKVCLSPGDAGCIQAALADPAGFEIDNPQNLPSATATMNTSPTEVPADGSPLIQAKSTEVPYMPVPYVNIEAIDPVDTQAPFNYLKSAATYPVMSIYLPIYIGGIDNITETAGRKNVFLDYFDVNGTSLGSVGTLTQTGGACLTAPNNPFSLAGGAGSWCTEKDPSGLFDIVHVNGNLAAPAGWDYAGLRIEYNLMNSSNYCFTTDGAGVDANCPGGFERIANGIDDVNEPGYAGAGTSTVFLDKRGMVAGNDLYYLTKLGRLELLGIPQIFYEPVYCNANRDKLVEGIFDLNVQSRNAFEGNGNHPSFAFQYSAIPNGRNIDEMYDDNPSGVDVSNPNEFVTFQDKVTLNSVFSGNEFMCCRELGDISSSASKCCSGFSAQNDNNETVCKLPKGADLNVYFNRFVSGDGVGATQPGGGFTDDDFVPETGEPKLTQAVYNKLAALGIAYCQGGSTRRGAAFGYFLAEPNSGFYVQENTSLDDSRFYSILDSSADRDQDNNTGNVPFQQGNRWDHHFYCQ